VLEVYVKLPGEILTNEKLLSILDIQNTGNLVKVVIEIYPNSFPTITETRHITESLTELKKYALIELVK